jgi:DNA-directed RNA polymerase subunit RPC12/RpoP
MATIAKSWVETNCETCESRRVFEVRDGWLLVCSACGTEKSLEKSGILAA